MRLLEPDNIQGHKSVSCNNDKRLSCFLSQDSKVKSNGHFYGSVIITVISYIQPWVIVNLIPYFFFSNMYKSASRACYELEGYMS